MSKADSGHIMPDASPAMSRRAMLHAGAVVAAAGLLAAETSAASSAVPEVIAPEPEWPEFRAWYALMVEEEALFRKRGNTIGERGTPDDERCDELLDQMGELYDAMVDREARTPTDEAVLAVLALYAADPADGEGFRYLRLAAVDQLDRRMPFHERYGILAIGRTIRGAIARGVLRGVAIYGEGGNA